MFEYVETIGAPLITGEIASEKSSELTFTYVNGLAKMLENLVFVAALASLIATFLYIRTMFNGETKPNRVTWLMWTVAPLIATAAALSKGVGLAVLPVFMAGFSPFLVFVASFVVKKSYWGLKSFDLVCGGLSALALVFWYVTQNPNVAIVFAIASDGLAAIPTLVKAWRHPETESPWPYMVGTFSALSSFAAIRSWTFSEYAFPAYLVVVNIILCTAIYHRDSRFPRSMI